MRATEPKDPGKKATVTVQIYGTDYKIRGDADPDYIKRLAAHVDAKMRDVVAVSSTVQPIKVAILAAINLADEYFRALDEQGGARDQVAQRLNALAASIEETIA